MALVPRSPARGIDLDNPVLDTSLCTNKCVAEKRRYARCPASYKHGRGGEGLRAWRPRIEGRGRWTSGAAGMGRGEVRWRERKGK